MERLTSKRSWEEAGKELGQECGYSHIWKRLNQIEDILGDTYDLDRSAWEPCSACKTEKIIIHVPAFKAMAVCNQHMDHGAFDLTLHLNFCPYCGRPLNKEAWEMLQKRLEGHK